HLGGRVFAGAGAGGREPTRVVPPPDLPRQQPRLEVGAARAILDEGVDHRAAPGELQEVREVGGTEHVHSVTGAGPGQGHAPAPTRIGAAVVGPATPPRGRLSGATSRCCRRPARTPAAPSPTPCRAWTPGTAPRARPAASSGCTA